MKPVTMIAAVAALASLAAPASAVIYPLAPGQTFDGFHAFDWRYSSGGGTVAAAGTLTAAQNTTTIYGRDAYVVTSLTGQRNGVAITGFAEAYPLYGGSDRYLYISGTPFTFSGFSFGLADGSYVNLFNGFQFTGNTTTYEIFSTDSAGSNELFSAATFGFGPAGAAAVPEPATWALMVGGFGLVGAGMRRRRIVRACAA